MNSYLSLNQQVFQIGNYKIVPIRFEDRIDIMNWRNEQIYHLRQEKPLIIEDQEFYFKNIIKKLFKEKKPNQLLFSYLENDVCIGYGGLVHINWTDKNAEISFVMNTKLQKDKFKYHWHNYLDLLEKVAFKELGFHKIFTYAFDLRPYLYEVLEEKTYKREARLKEHCFFKNTFIDVVIHQKINNNSTLKLRLFKREDIKLIFDWANEEDVRKNALNQDVIKWSSHLKWCKKKLEDADSKIFILELNENFIGQIRIEKIEGEEFWRISYSIDKIYRGKGYGSLIVKKMMQNFPDFKFKAEVKKNNIASKKVFKKLNFKEKEMNKEVLLYLFQ